MDINTFLQTVRSKGYLNGKLTNKQIYRLLSLCAGYNDLEMTQILEKLNNIYEKGATVKQRLFIKGEDWKTPADEAVSLIKTIPPEISTFLKIEGGIYGKSRKN